MTRESDSVADKTQAAHCDDDLWDARPLRLENGSHTQLIHAIGRLAISSAGAEALLRAAVYETYLFGDNASIVTEGESTSWLLEKLLFIIEQEFEGCSDAREACSRTKGPFARRNRFIHSELGVTPSGTYVTFMSRRHKELRPSPCTVDEILQLAEALEEACWDVHGAVRRARDSQMPATRG